MKQERFSLTPCQPLAPGRRSLWPATMRYGCGRLRAGSGRRGAKRVDKGLNLSVTSTLPSDVQKVRHEKLADSCDGALQDRKVVGAVDPKNLETCFAPIIQSGGNYNLKFSACSGLFIRKYR